MKPCSTCLQPEELQDLVAGRAPATEQTNLVAHLDGCPTCQERLDRLSGGGELGPALLHVDRRPASDSAYWPALAQLQRDVAFANAPTRAELATEGVGVLEHGEEVALDFLSPPDNPGQLGKLDHFDVVGVIGRGGMGIVLHGFDPCLQRAVALKVLEPRLARNELARQRFCREARTAARITHEHVVAVHQVDLDEHSGLPYLVMQLVAGESLEERLLRPGKLELAEVVRIGMEAAAGLAAAHAQGLIHRDVKPGNILLEAGTGRVKLTDFGLARATEDVKLTRTGFVAGTPLYMSPEQARGEEVDARCDLFSLGVVLYELCAGHPPFVAQTPLLLLRRLAEEPHQPLREVNPDVPAWLAEVIDRLLAKKPGDRFASADEVVQVLASHLSGLVPRPPLTITAVTTTVAPVAQKCPRRSWVALLAASLLLAAGTTLAWLMLGRPAERGPAGPRPVAVIDAGTGPVWSVAFAADGQTLAMGLDDGSVRLWDLEREEVKATLPPHRGPVWSVAFAPGTGLLATASDDGTVRLWPPDASEPQRVLKLEDSVRAVAFSPDGRRLATGTRRTGRVRLWDVDSGKEEARISGRHRGVVMSVAFSPDGKLVASGGGDRSVRVWNTQTGQERVQMEGHKGGVYGVAFAPGGRRVASGSWDRTVRLWDVDTGHELAAWRGHTQDVWAVAFSPDGRTLASASEDHTVKLWDVETGQPRATFEGHTGTLYTVAFSPDGTRVASAGRDGTVCLWAVTAGK
jgi:WD40 repeat protein